MAIIVSLLHLCLTLAVQIEATVTTNYDTTTPASPASQVGIGQLCSINLNCTIPKTVCLDYRCVCEPGLIFDKGLGKCVQVAGRKCGSNSSSAGGGGNGRQEAPVCASTAHCDPVTSTCVCNEPKYSVHKGNGKCYLNHGENCWDPVAGVATGSCHPLKYLKCRLSEMRCDCIRSGQVYDHIQGTCVANPGEVCDLVQYDNLNFDKLGCVQNAYCAPTSNYDDEQDYESYQVAKCKCQPGYVNVDYKYCMPGYGTECDLDMTNSAPELTCAPNMYLKCGQGLDSDSDSEADLNLSLNTTSTNNVTVIGTATGKCSCAPGSVLVATNTEIGPAGDENDGEYEYEDLIGASLCARILLAAEVCTPSVDICTPNSACVDNEIYYSYAGSTITSTTCQCLPGFVATPDGFCKAGYGSSCGSTSTSDDCNEFLSLECVNGTCQCYRSMTTATALIEFNGTRCVVLEGGTCDTSDSTSGPSQSPKLHCTNNAFCNPETSICECLDSYSVDNHSHKCYPATVGVHCDDTGTSESDNACLRSSGLTCVDGVCICNDQLQIFGLPAWPMAPVMREFDFASRKCVDVVQERKFIYKTSSELILNGQERHRLGPSIVFIFTVIYASFLILSFL